MSQKDTKLLLLDAAEELFAREGFHCTSLRTVTGRAGVNLAAVNYHFGSKEGLVEAIIVRRLTPLNVLRTKNLEEVREKARQEGRRPEVGEVVRAFLEPTLSFSKSGPRARDFITLIGRGMAEADDTVRSVFLRMMGPMFLMMLDLLGEALPAIPKNVLFWRLHFTLGAMTHTMHMVDKCTIAPEGFDPREDIEALPEMILSFVEHGLKAPL